MSDDLELESQISWWTSTSSVLTYILHLGEGWGQEFKSFLSYSNVSGRLKYIPYG